MTRHDSMPTVEDHATHDTVKASAPEATRSNVVADDIQLYNALAWEGADVKEIEEFIKEKCQEPNMIIQHSHSGRVSGWYFLTLDSAAKKAVEAHKGVKGVRLMKKTAEF